MLNLKILAFLTMSAFVSREAFCEVTQQISMSETDDSTARIKFSGKVLVANTGFAPIPAFSFDSPIIISSLSIGRKIFHYEPNFAVGLNGKPWIINNWLKLTFMNRKALKLKAGINPSLFFSSDKTASGEEVLQAQRNLNFELAVEHPFSQNWTLYVTYLYNKGCDTGTLSGHFFDVSSSLPDLAISKTISVNLKPQFFYFNFDGAIDGLFTSGSISIAHRKIPLSVYFQGVAPMWSGFTGNHFKWNTGLVYTFN